MLKPDHGQARLRRLARAVIVAAATERVLLQWNQFGRQTRSAPSSRVPGRGGAAFFLRKSGRPDLGRAGLFRRADNPRDVCLRDRGRPAAHGCVSWAFMAKPSINSTLTIKFSVRHAIERFHHQRDQ